MSTRTSEFEREMLQLEAELKRLEAEYNMFFAGRLPRLPWETRARVEALVKKHDRAPHRNTAERFRFGTLQARFVSFCELWDRALKAREEGRPAPGRKAPPPAAAPPAKPAAPPEKLVHVASFKDPARESERLVELYERLAEARREAGETMVPYHRFVDVVRAQVAKLGGGEREVAFRVAVKEGKVTLTAKPLKGA